MQTAPKSALTDTDRTMGSTTERSLREDPAEQVRLLQRLLQWDMTRSG
jgi:hypothetical protein